LYGAGPGKLAAQLNIDIKEAKDLQKKYFDTFPKIKKLMDNLVKEMKDTKIARSPLDGRFIDFSGLDWDNGGLVAHAMNQTKNLPFQGAGASTTKKALILIDKEIKARKLDAKIVNCVHDKSLLCLNPINCWKLLLGYEYLNGDNLINRDNQQLL
jgi:DNA polymerase-1